MSSGQSNAAFTIGYIVVILLIVLAFIWAWRRTRGGVAEPRAPGEDQPYIRGSDLYRSSLAHRDDSVEARQALGLPPQHDEPMWRDPPA